MTTLSNTHGFASMYRESEAVSYIPMPSGKPITVIGTEPIVKAFDETCIKQAINSREAPGIVDLILNPDAHAGYGAPIGSVMVSPSHIYPGPVGVDIKCSMSLLQLDLPKAALDDKRLRRALIEGILDRTPTGSGKGQRSVKHGRRIDERLGRLLVTEGASTEVLRALGIPESWAAACEDAYHLGHDFSQEALKERLEKLLLSGDIHNFEEKMQQLGSYGGGNHFGEANIVEVSKDPHQREIAESFGLKDGCVSFLSHCGSRGWGYVLASNQFKSMQKQFADSRTPFPGEDRELVYAPLGSHAANDYLDDMALGGNFATLNHLFINALVLEAFQQIVPGVKGELVYFISHNIARLEEQEGENVWVHRKGATRAFPAGHPALKDTQYAKTGHPILLPGNPVAGSVVMVAGPGANKSCFSVNHGAGRALGRRAAIKALDQGKIDAELEACDIMSNCRYYPKDEAPAAYKDFHEVLRSVEKAGLATTVAKLRARFVVKDQETR